mmetsp:Transcript_4404/g.5931  ORF Transcript_4404/g.5931 Transcript_4404/m.5931 type:complete len:252 (+) Transcript_4404:75-830(+)
MRELCLCSACLPNDRYCRSHCGALRLIPQRGPFLKSRLGRLRGLVELREVDGGSQGQALQPLLEDNSVPGQHILCGHGANLILTNDCFLKGQLFRSLLRLILAFLDLLLFYLGHSPPLLALALCRLRNRQGFERRHDGFDQGGCGLLQGLQPRDSFHLLLFVSALLARRSCGSLFLLFGSRRLASLQSPRGRPGPCCSLRPAWSTVPFLHLQGPPLVLLFLFLSSRLNGKPTPGRVVVSRLARRAKITVNL